MEFFSIYLPVVTSEKKKYEGVKIFKPHLRSFRERRCFHYQYLLGFAQFQGEWKVNIVIPLSGHAAISKHLLAWKRRWRRFCAKEKHSHTGSTALAFVWRDAGVDGLTRRRVCIICSPALQYFLPPPMISCPYGCFSLSSCFNYFIVRYFSQIEIWMLK